MKNKLITGLLTAALLLFGGCANQDSNVYHQVQQNINSASATEPSTPSDNVTPSDTQLLSGTLTISTFFDKHMEKRVQEFVALHPNVSIVLNLPDPTETIEQYGLRMATELMGGKAADLVDMAHFATFKYAKSGLFCDLYGFMENDSTFDKNDYYTNIFKGMEVQGGLYTLPICFTYDMMYTSRPLSAGFEENETLDYQQMLSLYEKALAGNKPATPLIMPGMIKEYFFRYEFPAYYDTASGKAWFDSPEFISYLKRTDKIVTPYDPEGKIWDINRIAGDDSFMKRDYLFCQLDMTAGDTFNFLIDYENILPPVPLVSTSGDALFTTLIAEYGIASNSQNKELAWAFLKFCIEEKTPPSGTDWHDATDYLDNFNGWVPINIANFYHAFRLGCKSDIAYFGKDLDVMWKTGNQEELTTKALDQIHSWNLLRNRQEAQTDIFQLVSADLDNYYYYKLETAEETALLIQNKMMAYLGE